MLKMLADVWGKQATLPKDFVGDEARSVDCGGQLMRTRSRSASPQRSKKEQLVLCSLDSADAIPPRSSNVSRAHPLRGARRHATAQPVTRRPSSVAPVLHMGIVPLSIRAQHALNTQLEENSKKVQMMRLEKLKKRYPSSHRLASTPRSVGTLHHLNPDKTTRENIDRVSSLQSQKTNSTCSTLEYQVLQLVWTPHAPDYFHHFLIYA